MDHPGIDPEITAAIKDRIQQLQNDGHEVKPVQFELLDHIVPAYYVLTTAEASSNLSRFDGVKYGYRTTAPEIELTDFYKQSSVSRFWQRSEA